MPIGPSNRINDRWSTQLIVISMWDLKLIHSILNEQGNRRSLILKTRTFQHEFNLKSHFEMYKIYCLFLLPIRAHVSPLDPIATFTICFYDPSVLHPGHLFTLIGVNAFVIDNPMLRAMVIGKKSESKMRLMPSMPAIITKFEFFLRLSYSFKMECDPMSCPVSMPSKMTWVNVMASAKPRLTPWPARGWTWDSSWIQFESWTKTKTWPVKLRDKIIIRFEKSKFNWNGIFQLEDSFSSWNVTVCAASPIKATLLETYCCACCNLSGKEALFPTTLSIIGGFGVGELIFQVENHIQVERSIQIEINVSWSLSLMRKKKLIVEKLNFLK